MWAPSVTIGADVTAVEGSWITATLAVGVVAAAAAGFRQVRGTTLAAPAVWAAASALGVAAVEGWLAWRDGGFDPLAASLWRYGAAAATFCPLMGVLGAKRPQDRGWQWVVLSLWVVLLVPAMQAVAVRSGSRLELFGAWRMLLAGLIAMGLLNYLPTRYALAAILFAIGQALLLGPYSFDAMEGGAWQRSAAAAFIAAASAVSVIASRRTSASIDDRHPLPSLNSFSERWFAFRDGWGAFWGLRVLQRVNQTAELSGWPVRLEWWNGFVPNATDSASAANNDAAGAQLESQIQQTLDSLLRRFEQLEASDAYPGGRGSC